MRNEWSTMVFWVNYALCAIAFYKGIDSYCGFIPFFGDLIGLCKIADEYENPSKTPFLITGVILIVFPLLILIFVFLYIFSSAAWGIDPADIDMSMLLVSLGLLIGFLILGIVNRYYRYKIINPLVQDTSATPVETIVVVIFAFIQMAFYIWLLIQSFDNRNRKDEW